MAAKSKTISKKNKSASPEPVSSRLVLNFPGFEKTSLQHQLGRLQYAAENTGRIWGFERWPENVDARPSDHHAIVESLSAGRINDRDFKTRARLVQFSWSDIVAAYENETFPVGFFRNLPKFLAFFIDGTVGRYLKNASRYFGFTIFPLLLFLLFCALAYGVVWHALPAAGFEPGWLVKWLLAMLLVLGLCKFPGDQAYLNLTIADWGFARDMINRNNKAIEERFSHFANISAEEIARSDHDEIIIVGHSFGSIWAVVALAKALEENPELFEDKKVSFLALGSSLLKLALSPKAGFIRECLARLLEEENLFWHEIQTKDDWIAFYKSDPFAPLDIHPPQKRYQVDRIRFKHGMDKKR